MIYSVWNVGDKKFHYYEVQAASDVKTNTPGPEHIPDASTLLGVSVYDAMWPLPKNAKFIGKGDIAKGHIATTEQRNPSAKNMFFLVAAAGAAYLVFS